VLGQKNYRGGVPPPACLGLRTIFILDKGMYYSPEVLSSPLKKIHILLP